MHRPLHMDNAVEDGHWRIRCAGPHEGKLGGRSFERKVWPPKTNGGQLKLGLVGVCYIVPISSLHCQAAEVQPKLDERFYDAQAWESLTVSPKHEPEIISIID